MTAGRRGEIEHQGSRISFGSADSVTILHSTPLQVGGEKAARMNILHLTDEQLVTIRRAAAAPADGAVAERSAHSKESFSLRLERGVEGVLRTSHPRATDAEIDFATAAYWTSILHDIRAEQSAPAPISLGEPDARHGERGKG